MRGGGDDVCVYVLLSEASSDACESSANLLLIARPARTSVADRCNERSTACYGSARPFGAVL